MDAGLESIIAAETVVSDVNDLEVRLTIRGKKMATNRLIRPTSFYHGLQTGGVA